MKRIRFKNNWNNKLCCKVFGSVRKSNEYYKVGERYLIEYRDMLFEVELIEKKVVKFGKINGFISGLDGGMNEKDFKKLIRSFYEVEIKDDDDFDFILLKRI